MEVVYEYGPVGFAIVGEETEELRYDEILEEANNKKCYQRNPALVMSYVEDPSHIVIRAYTHTGAKCCV